MGPRDAGLSRSGAEEGSGVFPHLETDSAIDDLERREAPGRVSGARWTAERPPTGSAVGSSVVRHELAAALVALGRPRPS